MATKSIFAAKKETRQKPTVLANNNPEKYQKWNGLTLLDVDDHNPIVKVTIGKKTVEVEGEDKEISSLIVELAKERVVFPFSRSFEIEELATDEDLLTSSKFYLNRKMVDGDEEGNPSGALYICFGKPSEITFDSEEELVSAEPATK